MACTPPTAACRALTEAAEQARALDNTTFLLNADSEPSGVAGVAAALGENPTTSAKSAGSCMWKWR